MELGSTGPSDRRIFGGLVAFLSDFGESSPYVGVCKGVMLRRNPGVEVVDLCHSVRPFSVIEGGWLLKLAAPYFPRGTVFLAVVDPGVGSSRRPLAVRTRLGFTLVGPDNGLLVPALSALGGVEDVREISNPLLTEGRVSKTFHGRDVFAPVAAALAGGLSLEEVGPPIEASALKPYPLDEPISGDGWVEGHAVWVDRFGNVCTDVEVSRVEEVFGGLKVGEMVSVRLGDLQLELPFFEFFAQAGFGASMVIPDSWGFLSLAVNGGSFLDVLGFDPLGEKAIFGRRCS